MKIFSQSKPVQNCPYREIFCSTIFNGINSTDENDISKIAKIAASYFIMPFFVPIYCFAALTDGIRFVLFSNIEEKIGSKATATISVITAATATPLIFAASWACLVYLGDTQGHR